MIRRRASHGILFCMALAAALPAGAEELEIPLKSLPASWENALPAGNGRIAARVHDSPARTLLTAALLPAAREDDPFRIYRNPAEVAALLRPDEPDGPPLPKPRVRLEIEWLEGFGAPAGFARGIRTDDGRIVSTHRQDRATVRRTILASRSGDALFVHAIADLPGTLGLRVRLLPPAPQTVATVDRRQLVAKGDGDVLSQVWVLPFESDVESGGDGSIMIRGEGEALVIFNLAPAGKDGGRLAETLERLGETHDPGHSPPNPAKIWQGVLESEARRNP